MRLPHSVLSGLTGIVFLTGAPAARAEGAGELDDMLSGAPVIAIPAPTLDLDLTDVLARESQPPAADTPPSAVPAQTAPAGTPERARGYGQSGSRWWTVGALAANNFHDATDFNVHLAFSQFIADDLEFAVEAAGWYFHQTGDDTGGVSGSMVFRWHFLHAEDYKWSVFGDAGIGILGAFDNVPEGGTGFDFLPRIGGGFTYALDDSVQGESRGSRLMVGVRYHHISNGRISGDTSNPARDAIAVYAALVFPF
jgi:hypothetical protein